MTIQHQKDQLEINYKDFKHISFDLWLTLIKSNSEFKIKRNLLFKEYFEINSPIEKVAQQIRYYDVFCNTINERTGLNIDTNEIYLLILASLDLSINEIEISKLEGFYKESESLFLNYKPTLIYANTSNYLKKIKSEEKSLNILSNTAFIKGFTLKKLIAFYELEDYFDFQIYSDECGFSKPNKKIFELIHKEVPNIDKSKILHVGDNEIADYKGAIEYGFKAHLIKQ
jgi:putative hydrolase of the HAD superfamily